MKLQNRLHHQDTKIDYRRIKTLHINLTNPPWQILSILLQFFMKRQCKFLCYFFKFAHYLVLVNYLINHNGSSFALFSWMWHFKYTTLIVLSYTLHLHDHFHKILYCRKQFFYNDVMHKNNHSFLSKVGRLELLTPNLNIYIALVLIPFRKP